MDLIADLNIAYLQKLDNRQLSEELKDIDRIPDKDVTVYTRTMCRFTAKSLMDIYGVKYKCFRGDLNSMVGTLLSKGFIVLETEKHMQCCVYDDVFEQYMMIHSSLGKFEPICLVMEYDELLSLLHKKIGCLVIYPV